MRKILVDRAIKTETRYASGRPRLPCTLHFRTYDRPCRRPRWIPTSTTVSQRCPYVVLDRCLGFTEQPAAETDLDRAARAAGYAIDQDSRYHVYALRQVWHDGQQ